MNNQLSPVALAVLKAACEGNAEGDIEGAVVAALRAVANHWRIDNEYIDGVEYIRTTTLEAIAAELKAHS